MASCIIPSQLEAYRKAWKEKDLDIRKLIKMSTEDRTALFSKYAGEDAKKMNTLFEEKLVLRNKVAGLKNFYDKTAEQGQYSKEKRDELAKTLSDYRAKQQDRILNPKENEIFLNDLADKILGTEITREQSRVLWNMSSKIDDLFKNYDQKTEKWSTPESKAEYGATKVAYWKYTENIKSGNLSVKGMLEEWSSEINSIWKEDKPKAVAKIISDFTKNLTNVLINSTASFDNSFLGRQGALTFIKSPKTWWNMADNSFKDIYKTFKGENPEDVLMADIYSDEDYINGNYEKAKLSFGIEEEIPSRLLERAPIIGKVFKASDVAFTNSAIRARRGLFKIMKETNLKNNIELTDSVLRDMGTIANAITARGKVGQIGSSQIVKVVLWAPKMLKADWDILTGHTFGVGLETGFGRKNAAITVAQVVLITAAIAAIAKAMGADVEEDPTSSDFLKIVIGNTHISPPFIRGMPQLITLMARTLEQQKKDSNGIITKLNDGSFNSSTIFDIGIDFLANKTTPPVGAVIAWTRGKDFKGHKPTISSTLSNFFPISVKNFIGLKDESSTQAIIGSFLDVFGISANTYEKETNWSESNAKELVAFKERIGDIKFKEANDKFNKIINDWLKNIVKSDLYKNLSDDEKTKIVTKKKDEVKKLIYKEYNFKPPKAKKASSKDIAKINQILKG